MDIVEQLQTTQIFEGLDTESLQELVKIMDRKHFDAGTLLFEQGDAGDEMFIILSGKIRIFIPSEDGEFTIRHYTDGQIFGEFALLDEDSRSTSADVTEISNLLVLSRAAFLEFVHTRPTIGLRMMQSLVGRIRYTTTYLQTIVDSTKLLANGNYQQALTNIEDSDNADIHNLMLAFTDMIERVQSRAQALREQASSGKAE